MTVDRYGTHRIAAVAVLTSLLTLAACGLGGSPEKRIARAEGYLAKADYQAALIELRNVLSSHPNDVRALLLAAQASLQVGSPERAEQLANAAAAAGAPAIQTAPIIARSQLEQAKYDGLLKALDSGQMVLNAGQRDLFRGEALLALRRPAEAGKAFSAVLTRDPASIRALVGLARVHLAQGDTTAAVNELDTLLAKQPQDAEGWWVRGGIDGTLGHYEAMEKALIKAQALASGQLTQPQQGAVLAGLIEARLARSDLSGAAKAQAELSRVAPFALATPYMSARVAMARQDFTGAVETLTRLLNAAPNFSPGRFLLGTAMLAQGNLNQAELHLARVVSESPDNDEARKLLAKVRMRLDRPDEAVQILSAANAAEDPQMRALLGIAQIRSGDGGTGVESLERGLRSKPDDPSLQRALVAAYVATGQKPKALAFLQQLQARHPDDIKPYLGLAELAVREGDRPGAIRILRQGLEHTPDALEARVLLMRLFLQEGQPAEADALAAQTLALSPHRADVLAALGRVDLEAARFDSALGRFRAATDVEPSNPMYWLEVGRTQISLNQSGAAESVSRALQLRPNWLPAVATLSLIDLKSGRGSVALERVLAARKASPNEPAFAAMEGDLRMAMKQYPEALQAYDASQQALPSAILAIKQYQARRASGSSTSIVPLQQWLDSHPGDQLVRTVLADAYRDGGQLERAIGEYERVLKAGNPRPALLNNLAWAYFQAGDSRAVRVAKDAYDKEPQNPSIADTYGWILLESARLGEGMEILRKAAEAAPGQADIQFHYAAALARTGRKQEAQDRLKVALVPGASFPSKPQAERLQAELNGKN